jgi:hypothetical protein
MYSKKCPTSILSLKIATAVFVETLDNLQYSTQLIPTAGVLH